MSSSNPTSTLLSLQAVTIQYGPLICLSEATISIRSGERIAIVGGNGSGKTSILDIMCGFIAPNSGIVLLKDIHANGHHPAWFAAKGVLRTFQSPRVFEQMTVMDCLTLSGWVPFAPSLWASLTRPNRYRLMEADTQAKAKAALVLGGWESLSLQPAGQLSYGQRKFLSILQLSLAAGDIAICDEPTAGLDCIQAERVLTILNRWQTANEKRSIIVAMHDLEFVGSAFDRVFRIVDGVLEEVRAT